ncbi:hypothetical protein JK635_06035, partial [Neobacillus sp. YIM B02564]|nr:hypothetical protein [Neobacillus paridis]
MALGQPERASLIIRNTAAFSRVFLEHAAQTGLRESEPSTPAAARRNLATLFQETTMDAPKANKQKTDDGNAAPALKTPTDLRPQATTEVAEALNAVL